MAKVIEEPYDVIGIGFGPANLALGIALQESQEVQESGMRFCFVEKQASFGWHSSLLLPGAQLQVSPLKDLATMRDPTSSYSFTNYLHQQGRLAAFINRDASIPSRREWSAYLHWAAKRMDDLVTYGQEVVNIEPVESSDRRSIRLLRITTRDNETKQTTARLTKNISIAVGGVPSVPPTMQIVAAEASTHVAHSVSYLPSLAAMEPRLRALEARRRTQSSNQNKSSTVLPMHALPSSVQQQERQRQAPLRFAVLGSGQSSAEISLHLRKTFPSSHVSLIFRSSALCPSDDSAFVNAAAFDPERTDIYWKAGDNEREGWLQEFKRTNYSVVRSDVLNEIDTQIYDQEIELGQPFPHADGPNNGWLQIRANTEVKDAQMTRDEDADDQVVTLTLRDNKVPEESAGSCRVESFDAVFLGTGFVRRPNALPFLSKLGAYFPRLDSDAASTKSSLGFENEIETSDVLASLQGDELALEHLRHRTRGITRDYRLVSYSSLAFSPRALATTTSAANKGARDLSVPPTPATASSASSSRSPDNDAAAVSNGSGSDSETLAEGEFDPTTGDNSASSSRRGSSINVAALQLSDPDVQATTPWKRYPKMEPSIYFLGGNESTHGLSDSLMSVVAFRSGELCNSLVKRRLNAKPTLNSERGRKTGVQSLAFGMGAHDEATIKQKASTLPTNVTMLGADTQSLPAVQ